MSKMNREDYGVYPPRRKINIVMQHGVSFGAALAMAISFNVPFGDIKSLAFRRREDIMKLRSNEFISEKVYEEL